MDDRSTEIDLWLLDFSSIKLTDLPLLTRLLTVEERKRLDRIRSHKRANQFIVGRTLLRHALAEKENIPPEDIRLSYTKMGKPYLAAHPNVRFNLSHSYDMCLCVTTRDHDIGADVEKIDPKRKWKLISDNFFSPDEILELQSLPNDEEKISFFFKLWTLKESLVKASALSIMQRSPMTTFTLIYENRPFMINDHDAEWEFHATTYGNYQIAVAYNRQGPSIINWHNLRMDDLMNSPVMEKIMEASKN